MSIVFILLGVIVIEFAIILYLREKLKQQQERFAGYLKYLDEQNEKLKQKIADLSHKKPRPQKGREFTL